MMDSRTDNHSPRLDQEIQDFLLERQIRKVSKSTLNWHERCLHRFRDYCYARQVTATQGITPNLLRHFVLDLETSGHNAGGLSNIYRSVKAFLNWCETEYDNRGWQNPARKVKVINRKEEPLDPLPIEHFHKLLATCERKTLTGDRDRALLMVLLDTGIRKAEIAALLVSDLDLKTGSVLIRSGKGGKPRTVFVGATTRRALMAYLREREAFLTYQEKHHRLRMTDALWISGRDGKRLRYDGVREVLRRRAADAGIPEPSPHSFRRAFAVNALRNGMNILTLQRLLGHSDLSVINRYVKFLKDDLQQAHEQFGVVDNL